MRLLLLNRSIIKTGKIIITSFLILALAVSCLNTIPAYAAEDSEIRFPDAYSVNSVTDTQVNFTFFEDFGIIYIENASVNEAG